MLAGYWLKKYKSLTSKWHIHTKLTYVIDSRSLHYSPMLMTQSTVSTVYDIQAIFAFTLVLTHTYTHTSHNSIGCTALL